MLINSDYNTLTLMDKTGKIYFRQINDYNLLKFVDFDSNRIMVKLNSNCEVIETFNNGIFNVKYGNIRLQLHNKQEIAKRLKYCMENKTTTPIKELILDKQSDKVNRDYLINSLKPFYDKIKFTNDSIIVKDLFKVNNNGQAYKLNKTKWSFLCIVVNSFNDDKIKTDLGNIKINFKTQEILFKVLFLLFPNKLDSVFMNQLTQEQKEKL